jgi:hypothetical protein
MALLPFQAQVALEVGRLQDLLDLDQEAGGVGAVDDAVVVGEDG